MPACVSVRARAGWAKQLAHAPVLQVVQLLRLKRVHAADDLRRALRVCVCPYHQHLAGLRAGGVDVWVLHAALRATDQHTRERQHARVARAQLPV